MSISKRAAGRAATAATRTIHPQAYARGRNLSRRFPRIYPRQDRRPQLAPTPKSRPVEPRPTAPADGTGLSLLLALLALQSGTLAPGQRARTWRHIRRWVAEIVEGRHKLEAA